ncbi:hypothetical protein B5K05_02950 [Rhizobium phaseoli]|nr:hypothetical protein B5K04_02945 [Rhizobium phaseoli]RDJ19038.1 hypothetical protein B5K05_02950 [Rhizobium phaseoli]
MGASCCPYQTRQQTDAAWLAIKILWGRCILPISTLVGEMSGRAEGGALRHMSAPHITVRARSAAASVPSSR